MIFVVMISGTSSDNDFRGFLIQAITCADETPVGMFMQPSGSDAEYQQACNGNVCICYCNCSEYKYHIYNIVDYWFTYSLLLLNFC